LRSNATTTNGVTQHSRHTLLRDTISSNQRTKTNEHWKTHSDKPVGGPEPTTLAHLQQFGDDEQRLGKQTMHSAQSMSGSQVAM
jgi:hypothetical protein